MLTRRSFIRFAATSFVSLSSGFLHGCIHGGNKSSLITQSLLNEIGPLLPPDANGVMLPTGFTSRIIARSGIAPYSGSAYVWHDAPDGGATFITDNGGWIYVSNSEVGNNSGGVGAIQFNSSGNIVDAYSILDNSNRNCAGGSTSWNTWLSCEENDNGVVWECDPYGYRLPVQRPALGIFAHEAAALDTVTNIIYLTEDEPDSCFYRFIPYSVNMDGTPDLTSGVLQVASVDSTTLLVTWQDVPDPGASSQSTRFQVETSTKFKGGEGIVFYNGVVSFATKGDNRIWIYNTENNRLLVRYDGNTHAEPILTGVDNITITKDGELVIGEDGGDLQIVAITKNDQLLPLVQLIGHDMSEMTGPAFSPDGKRLYFSSQRGTSGNSSDGFTYEITGPFHR